MKIGILDIQGSVEEHESALCKIENIEVVLVREKKDLENLSGLIMPGGESTTIYKLLKRFELDIEIKKQATSGMVVWGTCAGAILLGKDYLNLIDVEIERNAYGRQLDSFETEIEFENKKIPGVFIRAPKIIKIGKGTTSIAKHNKDIVGAKQENIMISTFHPELTDDLTVHKYFIKLCQEKTQASSFGLRPVN